MPLHGIDLAAHHRNKIPLALSVLCGKTGTLVYVYHPGIGFNDDIQPVVTLSSVWIKLNMSKRD
jgi:hypothetical protein